MTTPCSAQFDLDVVGHNGDDCYEQPMTSTCVIAPNGEIVHAFVDADFWRRMEPAVIIEFLKQI